MDVRVYMRLGRRWLWLILPMAIIWGSLVFVLISSQPTEYQSSSIISVGSFLNIANPNINLIQTGMQLAENYAELVKTHSVLQATVTALDLKDSADDLALKVRTRLIPNTSLLVITVS